MLHVKAVCLCVQVEWNKGHALNHLLDSLQLDNMSDVMPIYIGDDRTDEDAFAVLKQRTNGVGILVSSKVRKGSLHIKMLYIAGLPEISLESNLLVGLL